MRHGEHGAFVALQELLEPEHGFCVKVVCRLIEQQEIGASSRSLQVQRAFARHPRVLQQVPLDQGQLGVRPLLASVGCRDPIHRPHQSRLELSHLLHEGIEIGIGIGHLGGDFVEALDLGEHVPKARARSR